MRTDQWIKFYQRNNHMILYILPFFIVLLVILWEIKSLNYTILYIILTLFWLAWLAIDIKVFNKQIKQISTTESFIPYHSFIIQLLFREIRYIKALGSGMEPTIFEGDNIFFRHLKGKDLNLINVGDIVIFKSQSSFNISRIKSIDGSYVDLRSDNPESSAFSQPYGGLPKQNLIARVIYIQSQK